MVILELLSHDVQILSMDQLSRIVGHGDFTDLKNRIKYFDLGEGEKETHFCVLDGSKVVGVGGVQVNPYDKDMLWIKHISVDPKYRNKGVAKAIMNKIFSYASVHKKKIKHSTRSDMGKLYLEREAERLAKKYPGIVVEESVKRDTDFGNIDGWQASLEMIWPEAVVKRTKPGSTTWLATIKDKEVGQWDVKTNKGWINLTEAFGDAYYTVKKTAKGYEVAKFTDDNQPDHVYRVEKRGNHWWTDSPGFIHKAQEEKTIKIAKQYISDGEPDMVYYSVTDAGIKKKTF